MPQSIMNLLNPSAPEKSTNENSAACINMYLQMDDSNGLYKMNAYPTPGLTVFGTVASPVRALLEHNGTLYVVGGNKFYSVASNGTATILGTLNTSTGFAQIVAINQQLVIIDGTNGYVFVLSGSFSTTVAVNALATATTIQLSAMSGAIVGATIAITQDDSSILTTTITAVNFGTSTVTLNNALTHNSDAGKNVTITISSGSPIFSQILDSNFPQTTLSITSQDNFFIVIGAASQNWYVSAVGDGTTWPSVNLATSTGSDGNLQAIVSSHRELFLFTSSTTSVWDNAGSAAFVFSQRPDVYLEYGCISSNSIAVGNNTVFFLGKSNTGGIGVMMLNGYTPQIISTNAITYQLSTYTTVSDAIGFIYKQEHNEFYVLTFPTQGVTWVYDLSNQFWHQRQSLVSSAQTRWLANCYAFCYNTPLVGDFNSGHIYKIDMSNYTENSTAITRTITTAPMYESGNWIYIDRLQVDFDTSGTSSSAFTLEVSRDGGYTFGSTKSATMNGAGAGTAGKRVYWTRLGQAKCYVLRLKTTMNDKFIVLGAFAAARMGAF